MARKKSRKPSKRQRRRMRFQQVLFIGFAVMIIATFVISLFARP
jgi:hypothetical protein